MTGSASCELLMEREKAEEERAWEVVKKRAWQRKRECGRE